ncbi:bis-aminopropyl spermidine synthase family protein [Aureimonas endophytica]|nr:bis-aminopropyl spermidine synthase family protein [Aureimonas endophytica]
MVTPAPSSHSPDSTLTARIAEATALREGPEGVAQVLRIVFRDGPLPLRDLARQARLPLPVAGAVRRELENAALFERGGGVRLTEAGRAFCAETLGLEGSAQPRPVAPVAAGPDLPEALHAVLGAMEEQVTAGPPVDVTLDQAPCTPETALRRALAMHEAGAVEGRHIAIMGDDDSMSVAIPLVARALGIGGPRRITVFELDPSRCRQLREAAERIGAPVEIVPQDLRDPLPAGFHGGFDVLETDPPYTLPGMALFLRRGLEALRRETGLPVFLSYGDLAPGDQLACLRELAALGLAASRIRPSFNRYAGASILGSTGQLLELRTTDEVPDAVEAERFAAPIYTGEVRPKLRRYRCQNCGTAVVVGHGESFATIERLKAAGCPACGETRFRREGLVRR